jgi:threonine dehydratase
MPLIDLEAIERAREGLRPFLAPTPIVRRCSWEIGASGTFCKLENLQPTRSFKVRGALTFMLALHESDRCRGVVTASGGNHGLGVAYAAKLCGVDATVVLPTNTPAVRSRMISQIGAKVIMHGAIWNEARVHALALCEDSGRTYIPPFDDEKIMAGQGTIGLEIMEQCPKVDAIIAAVGGGGMISGVASAVRHLRPDVKVFGVETRGADCMARSLEAGKLVSLDEMSSVAESLGTLCTTERPFEIVSEAVEEVVVVSDQQAVETMRRLVDERNMLVEPAAAAAFAALDYGLIDSSRFRAPVVVVCGSNLTLDNALDLFDSFGPCDDSLEMESGLDAGRDSEPE